MNKKDIIKYLDIYLDSTVDYEIYPGFNSMMQGCLMWIKIERVT